MCVYLTNKQALAYLQQSATPDFWKQHWLIDDLRRYLLGSTGDGLFITAVKRHLTYDGIKGFKNEVTWLKPWLQPIYDGKRDHRLSPYLDKWLKPFASYCALLVMQKTSGVEG